MASILSRCEHPDQRQRIQACKVGRRRAIRRERLHRWWARLRAQGAAGTRLTRSNRNVLSRLDGCKASLAGSDALDVKADLVMTYIAKPKFHHPALPKNTLGYTHRDYEGTISTLCAGCGHDSITAAHHRGLLRAVDRAAPGGEDFRHRLLVQDAGLLPRQLARLQFGARPHAVGAHRRQSRQPRPDLSRRVGRRRLAPRSGSASSRTPCAAASTWSISSRTTACMA